LEDFDADDVDINSAREEREDSLGYYEFKKLTHSLTKGCSKLLDQRKQAKLQ
jgi:hypothetical protein